MEKKEEKLICAECGGYCCKKCGCDYFVSDFENLKLDYLESILDTGRVSIVAAMNFKSTATGKLINEPVLYMRARNINRGEIDLLSFKTTCASLEEGGCHFDLESRPSGGATLIPKIDEEGNFRCYSSVDRMKELKKWIPHQRLLQKIVEKRIGMSVEAKLRCDVEKLFIDVQEGHFDNVSRTELLDVLKMIPLLCKAYPIEANKVGKNKVLHKSPNKC